MSSASIYIYKVETPFYKKNIFASYAYLLYSCLFKDVPYSNYHFGKIYHSVLFVNSDEKDFLADILCQYVSFQSLMERKITIMTH